VGKLGKPVIPAGDYGLGLCVQCLGEVIIDPENAPQPRFAVTLGPLPQPGGVIAAPACFEHLRESTQEASPILAARGRVPR
jgi:hypothetical protein